MKFHHCLLDGAAGSVLAALLLDLEPSPPPRIAPAKSAVDAPPSDVRLLLESVVSVATTPVRTARYAARMTRRVIDLGRYAVSRGPKPDLGAMLRAPTTSFNAPIGPSREIAFSSVALDDVKALRRPFDAKVNDIVLALCSGCCAPTCWSATSSRRGRSRRAFPSRFVRRATPRSTTSCRTSRFRSRPTSRIRPSRCAIVRHTRAAKDVSEVLHEHPVGSIAETAPPFVIGGLLRLAYQTHLLSYVPGMMNTIVSNVPGPPMALYLAGARLTGIFSASVLLDHMGLNITLFTFGDRVDFGVHVDPGLVTDPWSIADAFPAQLAELMASAGLGAPAPVEDAFGIASPAVAPFETPSLETPPHVRPPPLPVAARRPR
jgi:diacylglycerol O-acyltransferase / wax synthase